MPVITCPNCGTQLNAPDSLLGQQVTCGKCRCLFVAQSQTPPSAQSGEARMPPSAQPFAAQAQGLPGMPPAGAGPASAPPQSPPQAPPMVTPPPPVGQAGYQQVTAGYYQPAPLATSGYAVASLVLGIASLVTLLSCMLLSLVCGPLAMAFSSRARNDIRAGTANPSSAGLATAGKICGLIGLLLGIGFVIVMVVGIVAGIMAHS
jgi:hypothetical protein